MIGFEGKLPLIAATFKRLVPRAMVPSERHQSIPPLAAASSVSKHLDVGTGVDDATVLVQGLTWADTVDLTFCTD